MTSTIGGGHSPDGRGHFPLIAFFCRYRGSPTKTNTVIISQGIAVQMRTCGICGSIRSDSQYVCDCGGQPKKYQWMRRSPPTIGWVCIGLLSLLAESASLALVFFVWEVKCDEHEGQGCTC